MRQQGHPSRQISTIFLKVSRESGAGATRNVPDEAEEGLDSGKDGGGINAGHGW